MLLCTREASRAAHRCRDAAQTAYQQRRHLDASHWKEKKENWYSLKERGVIALHRSGALRYIGASPQGMAIYEYGDGGNACFHSTLHPVGAERTVVTDHPETLFVEAKEKVRGISELRVEVTLEVLPSDTTGYERSAAPRVRNVIRCWNCGAEGHLARECWQDDYDYQDRYDRSMTAPVR